jgi:hypothetical protein
VGPYLWPQAYGLYTDKAFMDKPNNTPDPYLLSMRDHLKTNLERLRSAVALADGEDSEVIDLQISIMQLQLDAVETAIVENAQWEIPDEMKEIVMKGIEESANEMGEILDEVQAVYDQGYCYQLFLTKNEGLSAQDCIDFFDQWPLSLDSSDKKEVSRALFASKSSLYLGTSNDPQEIQEYINFCKSTPWKEKVKGAVFHYLANDNRLEDEGHKGLFYGTPDQGLALMTDRAWERFTHNELCDLIEKVFPYVSPAQAMELATSMYKKSICYFVAGRRDALEEVAKILHQEGLNVCLVQTSQGTKSIGEDGLWTDKDTTGGLIIGNTYVPLQ